MQKQAEDTHRLSRRGLFVAGGFTVAAAVAGSISLRTGWLRALYLKLAYPEPDPSATGSMEGDLLRTLHATAATVVGEPAAGRAIRMLQTRARELPGHLALQGRFAVWLDRGAMAQGAENFRTAGPETRTELLASCMQLRTSSDLERVWHGVVSQDRVLWDRHILQPMLKLYSRSDAWLELGYHTFPGDPSGLDVYREPIVATSSNGGIEAPS